MGKTYAWSKELKKAQAASEIALSRYSYVSLFGVNSLDELKLSIFENVITLRDGQLKADLNTLDAFVSSNLGQWRKFTRLVQSIPFVRSYIGGDAPALLSFLTICDQLICFDDLERRGSRLDIGDVLGIVSFLREQRACKVVLILNEEELTGDAKTKFETYLEKVVDVSLVCEPTAAESSSIALKGDDSVSKHLTQLTTSLGISNIRVIKKIERVVREIQPMLAKFDAEVFRQASSSLVLFCWSHDQPGEAPTLEFLTTKKAKSVFGLQKNENLAENEVAWSALLEAHGYTWTDELDLVLIEGVRNGYFDPIKIEKRAQEVHDKVVATKADGSFESAWRLYHDSFGDDQEEVLDAIYDSFMKNFQYITPLNLHGTITLFKDLGRQNQATEILKHYVENRTEPLSFFDLEHNPFGNEISDQDIREAFTKKCEALEEKVNVPAMLLALDGSWTEELLAELANVAVAEYRKAFKEAKGEDLRTMLARALQFNRISNPNANMKEISSRAREALKLIGPESAINARRVAKLGIKVEAPPNSDN